MTTTVDGEGEVDRMHFEVVTDESTYAMWLEEVGGDGFDSVSEALAREIEEEEPGIDGATEYDDRLEDDVVIVEVAFEDVTVEEISGMTTDVTDDETVVFADAGLGELSDEGEDEGEFIYRVEMPGEIVETNAEEIEDENVAVWYPDETDTQTAYVESEVEERSLLAMIALAIGLLGVAMVAVAAYQVRIWESYF